MSKADSKQLDFSRPPDLPELEKQVLDEWLRNDTFQASVEQRPTSDSYIFYDGPPFATGMPHYGHLLASTTKDVIPRFQTMRGKRVERVWGWDCHGLPIENMIEKQLNIKGGKKGIEELGLDVFNQACRKEVMRLDTEWEQIIHRLGRWVDFKNNYKTMDTSFMESVWWGFKQLYQKDLVYQGRRVILYCPRCATPLSNFEIAMDNSYQEVSEPSTTYKYRVKDEENTFILAWSTTPWNKLATPALAVHPNLEYVTVEQGDERYILAKDRLDHLKDEPYTVVATQTGSELAQKHFELHYDFYPERSPDEKVGVLLADEFVSAEDGTGIVTLAAYGEDDYRVMSEHGVQLVEHVDQEGKLKEEVKPWAGRSILDVNAEVDQDLSDRGLVYQHTPHTHNVAVCYRCSTRLYYAPVPAWFIDIQKIKSQLLENNEAINWYPDHLKNGRFGKGLEHAPDWNISRSRYWGTPMPIWSAIAADGTEQLRVIGSIEELKTWAVEPEKVADLDDIHPEYLQDVSVWVDDEKTLKGTRIPEVFDCWIESGSMPFASVHYPFENKQHFEQTFPAQFISEYVAQTRAWFYTMHVLATGVFESHAFENVLTTGTILAEDGSKMSKSKKNYPDPQILMEEYGVDSLRLYLMSSPVMNGENLHFSEKAVADIRRKVFVVWWNMLSFYSMCTPKKLPMTPPTASHVMDTWLLSVTTTLTQTVTEHYENYDLVKASRALMEFVTELSTWYLRQSRDRLRDTTNAEANQTFGFALYTLAQLMAPLAPFFTELVHDCLLGDDSSIHLTDWPKAESELHHPELEKKMAEIRRVVERAHAQRKELEMKVRQPLASLTVTSPVEKPFQNLLDVLANEVNVKEVRWEQGLELEVSLDTKLTQDLKDEGEAREVMRSIQRLRKKSGLSPEDQAVVSLPNWPKDWTAQIEERTNAKLRQGEVLELLDH